MVGVEVSDGDICSSRSRNNESVQCENVTADVTESKPSEDMDNQSSTDDTDTDNLHASAEDLSNAVVDNTDEKETPTTDGYEDKCNDYLSRMNQNRLDLPNCDDYGFFIDDEDDENPKCHQYQQRPCCDEETETKWRNLLSSTQWQKHQMSGGKMRAYIQRGVPNSMRGKLWVKLLDVDTLAMSADFSYKANVVAMREQLVELGICEFQFSASLNVLGNLKEDENDQTDNSTDHYIDPVTLRQIFCDIERTYPTHKMFSCRYPRGQEGCAALFRVLAVYARYNKKVGYCQGMSYIAGLLLMNMTETEAFWCMVALFERPKYLQGFYDPSLGRMRKYAAVFKKILCQRLPTLAKHLRCLEVQPLMFLTPWFLCLYAEFPCWDSVLAIWDFFLLDGCTVIIKVALAVMEVFETEMLRIGEMSHLLPRLLHLPHHIVSYETLIPVIWGTVIEPWEVNGLLAVISEEDQIRQKRKRILTGEVLDEQDGEHKRRRILGPEEESPSIFRKIVNFFTGKSGTTQKQSKKSHSQRLLRRAQNARMSRKRQFQQVEHVMQSEEFGGTPVTLKEDSLHPNRAQDEFTFSMFNTPIPFRKSQGRQLKQMNMNSPEVEMEMVSRSLHKHQPRSTLGIKDSN